MVWGCIIAYGTDILHIWKGAINAETYIQVLSHVLPSRGCLFQRRPCNFQQVNAKPHSASITKSWFHRRRVQELDWPTYSPDLVHHKMQNKKEEPGLLSIYPILNKNGTTFFSQKSSNWPPQFTDCC